MKHETRIGLALGSGSARGWAHIGIIQALKRAGITPHIVCGTSIGALVGGAHAMNRLDDLEQWARDLGWKEIIGLVDFSFSGGFIQGDRLMDFFRESVGEMTIESLPIPFATVATDLMTGREIWFQSGSMFDAIRASVSLPGLFSPALISDRYLIDGGLVNPVPVSLCRALGADIVIAVNLNSDVVGKHFDDANDGPLPVMDIPPEVGNEEGEGQFTQKLKEKLDRFRGYFNGESDKHPGLFDVLWTSINIMQDRITRSRMAGDPPDLVIAPRLRHLQLMEFHRAAEAIEEGFRSVERVEAAVNHLLQR